MGLVAQQHHTTINPIDVEAQNKTFNADNRDRRLVFVDVLFPELNLVEPMVQTANRQ